MASQKNISISMIHEDVMEYIGSKLNAWGLGFSYENDRTGRLLEKDDKLLFRFILSARLVGHLYAIALQQKKIELEQAKADLKKTLEEIRTIGVTMMANDIPNLENKVGKIQQEFSEIEKIYDMVGTSEYFTRKDMSNWQDGSITDEHSGGFRGEFKNQDNHVIKFNRFGFQEVELRVGMIVSKDNGKIKKLSIQSIGTK